MALFHLHVTQVKRSAGQSVVTSAAYRAGEKLYSEYYGEVSDYTHKGGVVCTDILLPPQAPNQYQDRATLWNAVEKAERGKKAQLAYSFDIALQNEFSLEENIALARQFVSEQLVGRGMIADFAIHQPDKEDGGIPNPHFHVLCPIRPIEPDGKWGCKQRRRYRLDEDGNRIMGEDGKPLFDAVPTTDWGSPETLEHWREAWAAMVNAKFEEYFAAKEKNIVGKPYEEWKHVIQKSLCKTYGEGHFEIRLHGDGEERILEFHEEPIFDVFNRVGQFCFCRDVTIERTFEHQIWISANTDALTGLYNRRFFYEYMNENRKENQLSLLYVDLDDFKKVNDAHGHHIGDGALELVARLMREAFPGDFIVRLGGDEFLICLVGERSLAFLEEKANRLLQSLLEAFQVSDYLRVMSASIGIASSADPGTKLDDLVRQSDIAMYAAKQSGKSRCCVYSSGLIKK